MTAALRLVRATVCFGLFAVVTGCASVSVAAPNHADFARAIIEPPDTHAAIAVAAQIEETAKVPPNAGDA